MRLTLNGRLLPGKNHKVKIRLKIAGTEQSGQGSSSTELEQGFKPKMVTVTCYIPFDDDSQLKQLFALAEALDSDGRRVIYTVQHQALNNADIRQVRFAEGLDATEDESLKIWRCTINFMEYRSTSERKEERQTRSQVQTQNSEGKAITPPPTTNTQDGGGADDVELNRFESVLSYIEDVL